MEVRTPEEVSQGIIAYAKQYCNVRYKQEVEMSNFKNSYKDEMEECVHQLKLGGLSLQKIDFHRVAYENSLLDYEVQDIYDEVVTKTPLEIAEASYDSILKSLSANNSNSAHFYKERYTQHRDVIIRYYVRFIETRDATIVKKKELSKRVSDLTQEIKDSGLAFTIVLHMYRRLRLDFKMRQLDKEEYDYSVELYDSIKEELFSDLETIEKEDRIDLKATKTVEITREEAIMRISSVIDLIETEQFDILKDQAKQDTFIFAIDYVDRYNKLLYSYNKYYVSRLGDVLEYWSNAELCKVMNLPGVRYTQREEYLIKN